MKYAYYPGCSLGSSAIEYDVSSRKVLELLGLSITEIPDWTCCGASAVEPVSKLLTYALPARNLALAEREKLGPDLLIPCSACYLNLLRVERELLSDKTLFAQVNEVLAEEGLCYEGTMRARHILDVLVRDVPLDTIQGLAASAGLGGAKIAPYYGCQILRPYAVFDDPEAPQTMNPILEALGAEVFSWDMGGRCCGASLMATKKNVALDSVASILEAAQDADAIVTVCPMCQMNLEAYQEAAGVKNTISILYLPQLMGLAFGLPEEDVLLGKNMAVTEGFRAALRGKAQGRAFAPATREG